MYSFMNVFLNPYTRTECNFFVILFAIPSLWRLSRDLSCIGSGIPYFYCTVYCMSYSLCVHLNSSVVETSMNSVWRNEFSFFKFKLLIGIKQKGLLFPPGLINLPIYQADGIMIFVLWTRKCLQHGYSDDFLVFNLYDGMIMMIIIMIMTRGELWLKSIRPSAISKEMLYLKVAWTSSGNNHWL